MAMNFDVKDFRKEVLEKSYEIPVLVDFWAEWCAPCRILGPMLERLAEEANGTWQLAKVDTEEHPEVALQYGVRSIPNVKLFVEGKVAAEFVGALPEPMIRQWLNKVIPSRHRRQLVEAQRLLAESNIVRAQEIVEKVLEVDPGNTEAKVLLARTILFDDPSRAEELVKNLEEPRYADVIDAVRVVARLAMLAQNPETLPEAEVRETYRKAIKALLVQDFEAALQYFIEVIRTDRYYDDDGSRKACVAIFKLLGEEHEITVKYRRDFSSALYI